MNELMRWYGMVLQTFPRNHRYGLGSRIENSIYDLLHHLIRARYNSDKQSMLTEANLELEFLRFLVRLAAELKLISMQQHYAFISQINNLGKQLGGWIKSLQA